MTENVLLNSIEKYKLLVFKCDGMAKNKNVPSKIFNILKTKYPANIIISNNRLFQYDLQTFIKLVMLFYINFILILLSFHYNFVAWSMWLASSKIGTKKKINCKFKKRCRITCCI